MAKRTVNMRIMLRNARTFNYAIAHINTNNLEWTKAIIEASKETSTPVIIGVSEGAAKYMGGFKTVTGIVDNLIDFYNSSVPVALHLDHGSYDGCIEALKAGFSSVMYDGSKLPIEENIANTSKIVKLAKKYNASVEAEVGGIGGSEDGVSSSGELADFEDCMRMTDLKIDALAVAFGSIHGLYPSNWKGLDYDLLNDVQKNTNIPIVLHGGTGISDKMIKKAISLGVSKINVNTECQLAFAKATRTYFSAKKDLDTKKKGYDPRKILNDGTEEIKKVIIEKFRLFGSIGIFKE